MLLLQVLTEDPAEANLFFLDSLAYWYSSNIGSPTLHMQDVIGWVVSCCACCHPALWAANPASCTAAFWLALSSHCGNNPVNQARVGTAPRTQVRSRALPLLERQRRH
jgi:hypothetical protein